jgi:1-acyl-sn-glycerol-3-phosphate acyltransferase
VRRGELNRWWQFGLPLVVPLVRLLFRLRVRGLEHVPASGAAIVAMNHVSFLDGPVLAIEVGWRLRRESRFLVAAEMFRKRFFGPILRRYDQIPIRRGEGDAGALDEAIETIKRGALAAIAPEGKVNPDPGAGLTRIRSGVARIALPTGAPVVPVGIWGTQARYPKEGVRFSRPLRPSLAIVFGAPMLPVGAASDPEDVDRFLDRLREHLEEQVTAARRLSGDLG